MSLEKPFNKEAIEKIPSDQPQGYKLFDIKGDLSYVGIAKRGRINERLLEHKNNSEFNKEIIDFATKEFSSIDQAREWEEQIIAEENPKFNKQG